VSIPGEGLFRSVNNGASWTEANTGLTNLYVWDLIASGSTIFAATGGSGVFRSTDNGMTWSPATNGMGGAYLYSLGINGTTIFAGGAGATYRSTNNGDSWSLAISGMGNVTIYSFASNGTDLFAGSYQLGVYRSTNNGATWSSYGLNQFTIEALAVNGVQLFAGIEGPLQRRRISPTESLAGITALEITTPLEFSLAQNYPNPFNPTTTIQFSIPQDEHVVLSIFDINGSEVVRLVDERLASGVYERTWNARSMASGVYFYRIDAGSFSQVKRLTLVK
jgi:hypothetical protein